MSPRHPFGDGNRNIILSRILSRQMSSGRVGKCGKANPGNDLRAKEFCRQKSTCDNNDNNDRRDLFVVRNG
jgi:hypothetical protein